MFLVDTSVWIDYLRGTETEAVSKLEEIQAEGHPFGITGLICQEILQVQIQRPPSLGSSAT